ncbi:hypothetical protein GCM10009753_77550 [Streptantibioticus ferralitis]
MAAVRRRLDTYLARRDPAALLDPRSEKEVETLLSLLGSETDRQMLKAAVTACAWLLWYQYQAAPAESARRYLSSALVLLRRLAVADPAALPDELGPFAVWIFGGPHGWAYLGLRAFRGEIQGLPPSLAVDLVHCALRGIPADDPDHSRILAELATAYRTNYVGSGDIQPLNEAIALATTGLDRISPTSPDRPSLLSDLSLCLVMRSRRLGGDEDAAEAVRLGELAAPTISPGDSDRGRVLSNSARACAHLYGRTERPDLIGRAVVLGLDAVAATAVTDPYLAGRQLSLGIHAWALYQAQREEEPDGGGRTAAHIAVDALRQALDLTAPEEEVHRSARELLPSVLHLRYEDWGDLDDLAASLRL